MSRDVRAAAAGAVALLALGAWIARSWKVTTDVVHFLPEGASASDLALARDLAFGELSRTLVLVVRTGDPALAPRVSRELEDALRAEPRVAGAAAFVEGGPPVGLERALWELYEPRRFAFAARDAEGARAAIAPESLAERAAELRRRLALPVSSLLSRVAPGDPLLALPRLLERLQEGRSAGLAVAEGRFVADGGESAVLFLGTRAPSSDNAAQRPFLAGVRAAFERVDAAHGGALALEQSGASRYGLRMEDGLRADVRRVSIGSTVLLAALFLLLFRSLRLALLALPVVGAGFLAGTAACLAAFGSVHAVTLAFGAALIGVSVDYAVHFHCHQVLAPSPAGPRATLRALWPGLCLGAATTVAGFVALLASTFPGLRELALFSAAGIAAALLAAGVFLPALARRGAEAPGASRSLARALAALLAPRRSRALLALPAAACALVALVGVPRLRWDDALGGLNRLDPELLAEDAAVRARVAPFDQGLFVVVTGADEEQALRANDRAADELARARADGLVENWWSAAALLPSAERQREVDAVLRGDPDLWERARAALAAEGFAPDAFAPFRDALRELPPAPLRWADLAQSPLAPLVRPFRIATDRGRGVGLVSFVRGVADERELARRLSAAGARLVDVEGELSGAYGAYRRRMVALLSLGLVGVIALVALRHAAARPRTPRAVLARTAVAAGPALLACAATVGLLALCGVTLNLLSLVALLMVASMGVDYGVFLTEAAGGREDLEATLLSVCVAGLSTLFGFGLLALSQETALRSIGLTSGVGVLLCLVLATTMRAVSRGAVEVRR